MTATWKTVKNSDVSLRMVDGELFLCISFHKTDSRVHRFTVLYFQSHDLSLLAFAYMALVRPLEIRFVCTLGTDKASLYNMYLFTRPSRR